MISTRKQSAAFEAAGIPVMPQTRAHIWHNVVLAVPATVLAGMTAKQIGGVIAAAHHSFLDVKTQTGAEVVDDVVWIGSGVDRLVPLAAIERLEVRTGAEEDRYTLDYIERH